MPPFINLRSRVNRIGLLVSFSCFLAAGLLGFQEAAPDVPQRVVSGRVEAGPSQQVDKNANRKAALTEHLAQKYRKSPENVRTFVDLAFKESSKHPDVTPELILAVIQKESSLNPAAKSGYGAQGLMQVVQRFHFEKLQARESLFDAHVNIRVGAEILQEYISQTKGDLPRALRKYSGNASGYPDFVLRESSRLENI